MAERFNSDRWVLLRDHLNQYGVTQYSISMNDRWLSLWEPWLSQEMVNSIHHSRLITQLSPFIETFHSLNRGIDHLIESSEIETHSSLRSIQWDIVNSIDGEIILNLFMEEVTQLSTQWLNQRSIWDLKGIQRSYEIDSHWLRVPSRSLRDR